MKRITIITSLYKASSYLEGFLENIVQQTFFSKCKLFLLNANSPENEDKIIAPYLNEYADNILYEKLDEDPGLYECWNYMIRNTKTEYITNANVDDKLFPTCIEEHVNFLDENKDIDVAYCFNATTYDQETTFSDFNGQINIFPTAAYSYENLKEEICHIIIRYGAGIYMKKMDGFLMIINQVVIGIFG